MSCGCNNPCDCTCCSNSGSGGIVSPVANNLIPSSDNIFDLGSTTRRWRNLFIGSDIVLSCLSTIRQNTADGADTCITTLTGGGFALDTRGAILYLYGNESVGTGGIRLQTGNVATASIVLVSVNDTSITSTDDNLFSSGDDTVITTVNDISLLCTDAAGTIIIGPGNTARWVFNAAGALVQNGTNGSNIIMTATATGLLLGVSALDADVGTKIRIDIVGVGGTDEGVRTIATGVNAGSIGIFGYKTRSTGTDANTIVVSGDELLSISARGADGVVYRDAAQIGFAVDATPGAGDMPGRIVFRTSSDGAVTPLERWRMDSSGNLLQNATNGASLIITKSATGILLGATSLDADAGTQPRIAIVGNTTTGGGVSLFSTGVNTTSLGLLAYKTRSTSTDANTVVVSGDELFTIYALGADGTDYEQAAKIVFTVDGTPGNNDMPGAITFYTTPDGSNSTLSRLKIGNDGIITVVTGDVSFSATGKGPIVVNNENVTAAGANQVNAQLLSALVSGINAGAVNTGVRLPTPVTQGKMWTIFNNTGTAKNIYPGGTDNFCGIAASTAVSLPTGQTLIAVGGGATVWAYVLT